MVDVFIGLLKSLRPRQWLKNLSLYAAIIFSGELLEQKEFTDVTKAFFLFCALSSAVYLINDVIDAPKDREHPFKKLRPIAQGQISPSFALLTAGAILAATLYLAYSISFFFYLSCLAYLTLQILYTLILKQIVIMDVLMIASGFILRIYAGAFVINAHLNVWLILTIISVALFLAVGKRRSELEILKGTDVSRHRNTLSKYSEKVLDMYVSMFATSTWITYAIFTFQEKPPVPRHRLVEFLINLPTTLEQRKWLMLTIPLVIYGLMRYMQVIYEKPAGESPERVLLSDRPLLTSVILWGILVVGVIYIFSK